MLSFCFTNGVGQALVNRCEVVEHTRAKRPTGLGLRTALASYLQWGLGWPNFLLLHPPIPASLAVPKPGLTCVKWIHSRHSNKIDFHTVRPTPNTSPWLRMPLAEKSG